MIMKTISIPALKASESTQLIDGPVGKLELSFQEPAKTPRKIWGIICHPHPLFGGTMHNKVVTTLAKTFQNMGVHTIRFNFRGVMRSEGQFDNGVGELEDLLAVIDWVQAEHAEHELWLGGFSFGAYIAAKAATQIPVKNLVTVAPPVENFPMTELPPIFCKWVLAQGEVDDVVSPQEVFAFAETRDPKPIVLKFPDAGHYFHGMLGELRTRIETSLKD